MSGSFLLALALSSLSSAAESPRLVLDRDLSGEFGPVRDQKDIGWCYANATADILGWRYRTPEPVSAAHVALLRNRTTGRPSDSESGALSWAIFSYATLNERGLCKASALEGHVFPRLRESFPSLHGYQDVFALLRRLRAELSRTERPGVHAVARRVLRRLGLRGEPTPAFIDFLSSTTAEEGGEDIAQGLADRLCARGGYMPAEPRLRIRDLDVDVAVHPSAALEAAEAAIGRHFGLGELPDLHLRGFPATVRAEIAAGRPVAFAYSSGFLNDASKPFSYGDLHASVIVGARCAAGRQCVFKIRNSWGARCAYRNPEIQRSCLPDPGHFWITEDQLNAYGSSIVRFRN